MQLYYHNRGLHWALGLEGTKSEINEQYNSLFNHGAIGTTADLQWMGENFAYVWTTQERLKKYFKNASYHEVLNDIETNGTSTRWVNRATRPSDNLRFGAMVSGRIRERAKERYSEMINENFLPASEVYTVPWSMGTISAEKPDN
jgi:hypothetical protein|tara:strand:- start:259 stop:693 length:435 start_codon:yes stop_codon:yes gene_type:complete